MRISIVFIIALVLSGCSITRNLVSEDLFLEEPTISKTTKTQQILMTLPAAKKIVTISVYDFRDYTGQNKPGTTNQYSRAVTQGGLSILKKALLDAGQQKWFRVLERGGLANLLEERKIIRSIRSQYSTPSGGKLPGLGPLLYSGMLLEGGIIAYESNVATGGVGARYLGIGASTEYRRDMVTVYLRAISVTSGEVLLAVNTSKTIFSAGVSGGMFKYVSFDEILESEAGFTVNEPPQLAVRQAIEMAVYSMIMDGAMKGLWTFSDLAAGQTALENYLARKHGQALSEPEEQVAQKVVPPHRRTARANYAATNASRDLRGAEHPQSAVYPSGRTNSYQTRQASAKPALQVIRTHDQPILRGKKKYVPTKKRQVSRKSISEPRGTKVPLPTRDEWGKSTQKSRGSKISPGWYLQVAAVRKLGLESNRVVEILRQTGYSVKIQETTVESLHYYRILVGPYRSQSGATDEIDKVGFVSETYGDPFVRRIGY